MFPIRFRSGSDPVSIRFRSGSAPVPIRAAPVQIRFRSGSDPVPILLRIRFRSASDDPVPIRFRSSSDTVPIQFRSRAGPVPIWFCDLHLSAHFVHRTPHCSFHHMTCDKIYTPELAHPGPNISIECLIRKCHAGLLGPIPMNMIQRNRKRPVQHRL